MSRRIALPPRKIRLPRRRSGFFHAHAHARHSSGDAMSDVADMVAKAADLGQPAMALTDHGNMAGSVQLYKAATKHGIAPFPGQEFYLKRSVEEKRRYHVGILALDTDGYRALTRMSSKAFTRPNFNHKPHVTFADFAEWAELGWTNHLALTTGCFFGMVQQTLLEQGEEAAKWLVQSLASWFPHTYVELQHHNIRDEDHDDDALVEDMYGIALDLSLPVIATQDCHYLDAEDKVYHETLKRLISWGEDGDDAVFPGDSFHLASAEWVADHYTELQWRDVEDGLKDLLSRNNMYIPELESYSYRVPEVTAGNPYAEMMSRCNTALSDRHQLGEVKNYGRYFDRMMEEAEVVRDTNMAGYLMLNAQICDWMREKGIFYQIRGSASGSLICWLLEITQMDPVVWGNRYERFLSRDRTKPPDIDIDVEDARRGEVIAMLDTRFNVCQIGTWAEHTIDAETRRGALFVSYISRKRKDGVNPGLIGTWKSIDDLPRRDREEMLRLSKYKTFKSYGTHAGGLVIASTKAELDLIPTMLVASSDTTVTQYDMDDIEDMGFLKEDILGQKSLSTLRRCIEMIGRKVTEGWDWIPLDDADTYRAIRRQDVDGVFQLEGWTNGKGCKELKPKKLRDLIHLVSLYRPAVMESGMKDSYISRRAGWEKAPDRHPILNKALRETHGIPVFQDQVIVVLREIGFTPDDLTKFLKAVKASNENIGDAAKVIESYREMFVDLATKAGFDEVDITFTWDAIEGFSKYGFNKAHATSYGHRAYVMAYLRTHHSLEFHTALLQTWSGSQKEREYILAAKNAGHRLMKPHVNISGALWSIDRQQGGIRRGLLSIKHIGAVTAKEIESNAPYSSIQDLIDRTDNRAVTGGKSYHKDGSLNGALAKLDAVGALKGL